MKTHTIVGQQMLNQVGGVLERVGIVVRASHESYDGRGYPDGLAREEIPIEARVVSCCDAFSAMTTDRSYRRAMTFHEAVDELDRNAGTQFDPLVVEALKFAIGARLAEDLLPRRDTPELVTPPVGLTDRMNHQPRASAH